MKKRKKNRIIILIIVLIIAKKVYHALICRIGMGFTEDHESLVIKSHTSNVEVAY